MAAKTEAPTRIDVLWAFEYHLTADGEKRKKSIKAHEIHSACFEFHALVQLADKIARDGYVIERVESNHVTKGSSVTVPTPQVYLASDLPPRNPDASAFNLPKSLHNRIYPTDTAEVKAS